MEDCIFCKIIKGEIPSKKIYEDEDTLVFLDIDPSTNGDMLLIPKKHKETIFDIDEEFLIKAHKLIKQTIYPLLKDKLHCEGLTIAQNNFYGQDVKHFHIHLTPRYQGDYEEHKYNKNLLKDIDEIHTTIIN